MMKTLRTGDVASGLFLIVIGGTTIFGASNIVSAVGGKMHPRTLPMMLGVVLVAGGLWLIFRTFSGQYKDKTLEWPDRRGWISWLVSLVMMGLYAGLMQPLGFLLTSGLFVTAFIRDFGKYRLWFALAWGAGTVLFVYVLFIWLLSMEVPAGLLPL